MVKLNEALLVGISLLAALVFSKGRESTPSVPTLSFVNPFANLLDQAQVQAIEQQESNIATLENIRESNLGIAKNILDYEKNISDVEINQLQTELGKTRSFISQQQRNIQTTTGLTKDQSYWANQLGGLKNYAESILRGFATTQNVSGRNVRDLRYLDSPALRQSYTNLISQENIAKANEFIFRQQGEIDRLQEEYQTRYGNLSRYG